jgi:hypothetical protein
MDFRHAANIIKKYGVPLADAEAVLWNEVFPVLNSNLLSVAGVWAGWPTEWLKANLRPSTGPAVRVHFPQFFVQEINRCWQGVLDHVSAGA